MDHLSRITSDSQEGERLRKIYAQAALSLCDSRILEKILRSKNFPVKEVIPGSTLTDYLFKHVISETDTVLVVGVEDEYIKLLRTKYPKLKIEHINPSMGFINREGEVVQLLEQMATIKANYVFISVGSPRQEVLADRIAKHGAIPGVGLCVGASVLFLVDAEKRAPQWLQSLHLEWLYRMLQDPGRLVKRYFGNFLAIPQIYRNL